MISVSQNQNFYKVVTPLAIFLLGLGIFLINTLGLNFGFGVEESRYILFAQEMLQHGFTPFPTLFGQPYPDYPATHTVLIYWFSLLHQQVTPFTAILPSALASALTLVLTYRLGALHSSRWGLFAVVFLLATYEFLLLARTPSPDPLVALIVTASFYWVYVHPDRSNIKNLTILNLLFFLGFMIRGPLGLILPALVTGFFYLLEKKLKPFFLIGITSICLLIICVLLQLFIAQKMGGPDFAKEVFFMEAGGRVVQLGQRVFYYYFVNALGGYALAFPVAVLVLISVRKQLFQSPPTSAMQFLKQLAGWVLIILVILSFPREKHFRYIIPIAPALALIASYVFIAEPDNKLLSALRFILLTLSKILPYLALGLIAYCFVANHFFGQNLQIYFLEAVIILFILMGLNFVAKDDLATFSIGIAAIITLFITIGQPLAEQYITSVKPLIDKVNTLRQPNQPIVFYGINSDREGVKFAVLLPASPALTFISTPAQIYQTKQPAIFITQQKYYDALPPLTKQYTKLLWQQKLARNQWLVFEKIN